jgi:hypothetical protein
MTVQTIVNIVAASILGDYDLCFLIMDLYTNQIDKYYPIQAAA